MILQLVLHRSRSLIYKTGAESILKLHMCQNWFIKHYITCLSSCNGLWFLIQLEIHAWGFAPFSTFYTDVLNSNGQSNLSKSECFWMSLQIKCHWWWIPIWTRWKLKRIHFDTKTEVPRMKGWLDNAISILLNGHKLKKKTYWGHITARSVFLDHTLCAKCHTPTSGSVICLHIICKWDPRSAMARADLLPPRYLNQQWAHLAS